jgi:hypothetical protein
MILFVLGLLATLYFAVGSLFVLGAYQQGDPSVGADGVLMILLLESISIIAAVCGALGYPR